MLDGIEITVCVEVLLSYLNNAYSDIDGHYCDGQYESGSQERAKYYSLIGSVIKIRGKVTLPEGRRNLRFTSGSGTC